MLYPETSIQHSFHSPQLTLTQPSISCQQLQPTSHLLPSGAASINCQHLTKLGSEGVRRQQAGHGVSQQRITAAAAGQRRLDDISLRHKASIKLCTRRVVLSGALPTAQKGTSEAAPYDAVRQYKHKIPSHGRQMILQPHSTRAQSTSMNSTAQLHCIGDYWQRRHNVSLQLHNNINLRAEISVNWRRSRKFDSK